MRPLTSLPQIVFEPSRKPRDNLGSRLWEIGDIANVLEAWESANSKGDQCPYCGRQVFHVATDSRRRGTHKRAYRKCSHCKSIGWYKKTADSRGSGSSQTAPKPSYYFPRLTYSGRIDLARAYNAQEVYTGRWCRIANLHTPSTPNATSTQINNCRRSSCRILSGSLLLASSPASSCALFRRGRMGRSGFFLTTVLGIAGAFVATFIGQTIGRYQLDQGAGLIGATVGAVIVLIIWNRLVVHHLSAIRARDRSAAGHSEPARARIFDQCDGENIATDCH